MKVTAPLAVVVLAAGKGTRMKSELPKPMVPLAGKPMIHHILTTLQKLSPARTVVVTGYQAEVVESYVSENFKNVRFVQQKEQLGTAHAVLQAKKLLGKFAGNVLVVYGDAPLVPESAFKKLLTTHRAEGNMVSEITTMVEDPTGFGRILRDAKGAYQQTVEEKEATDAQKKIAEVSTCLYAFTSPAIWPMLEKIDNNNAKGEYYLTRIMTVAKEAGHRTDAITCEGSNLLLGANSMEELAHLEALLAAPAPKKAEKKSAATTPAPPKAEPLFATTGLPKEVAKLITEAKTPVDILTALPKLLKAKVKGQVVKGTVEKGAVLHGAVYVGKGSTVHSGVVIEGPVFIGDNVTVRPHANIRHGAWLCSDCVIGHGADIKNILALPGAKIQDGSFAGDSVIGRTARVGSGVILANRKFNQSTIGVSFDGGKPVDSKRDFLGCFMGDESRLGANVVTSPGTVVGAHTWVGSGAVISGYLAPNQLVTVKQELECKPKEKISLKAGKAITYDL